MPDDLISTNKLGDLVTNQVHIVVSEAIYADEGRWSRWADGGGSSLERRTPRPIPSPPPIGRTRMNPEKPSGRPSPFTGRLDNGNEAYPGPDSNRAPGAGKCLVDNVTFFRRGRREFGRQFRIRDRNRVAVCRKPFCKPL